MLSSPHTGEYRAGHRHPSPDPVPVPVGGFGPGPVPDPVGGVGPDPPLPTQVHLDIGFSIPDPDPVGGTGPVPDPVGTGPDPDPVGTGPDPEPVGSTGPTVGIAATVHFDIFPFPFLTARVKE